MASPRWKPRSAPARCPTNIAEDLSCLGAEAPSPAGFDRPVDDQVWRFRIIEDHIDMHHPRFILKLA